MARIKKRSGEMQEFDRQKLEESIRRAGASRMVSQELGRENSALSGAYTSTRKLRARSAADLASGVALLNEDILKKHGLEPGQNAYVVHMDKRADVQVRMADSVDQAEILMSRSDLEKLGASDGTRVNIRLKA
jgi:hypothetical protein